MNKIANSSSNLTKANDSDIISRNHGDGPLLHHPFDMGSAKAEFRIDGARVVKLSGGLNVTAPILVDNFILMGLYPSSVDANAALPSYYKVMGTSDSSTFNADGEDTKSIDFKGMFYFAV